MAIGRNPRRVGVILVLADTGLVKILEILAMHVALRRRMARVLALEEPPKVVVLAVVQAVDLVVDLAPVLAKARGRGQAKALATVAVAANPSKLPSSRMTF